MCLDIPENTQANSGAACSEASSKRRGLKTCVHTNIVGIGVLGEHYKSNMSVDESGDGGVGDDAEREEVGTAKVEWAAGGTRQLSFVSKVMQLMKIIGVLRFPVNPTPHLSAKAKESVLVDGSVIPCQESVCPKCLKKYEFVKRKGAIAVTQVSLEIYETIALFCSGGPKERWFHVY